MNSPVSRPPSPAPIRELPAQYDHAGAQDRWYREWEQRGYFHADPASEKPPFCIVIPPPNVTGALHLGHALNNTLQDILVRMKRMQGFNTLWMPGTDHAGIATQAVVERRLLEDEQKSRHDLGREGLVKRIWQWKDQYEARIIGQLKRLGCSCDWERLRFTLDDQCARAVRETFFQLFSDGKIYRGKRLVNWDTYLQTAVSDDEVFHDPKRGHFWHFRYPVIDPEPGAPKFVTIATTRPETMLGDTAVAVHPDPAAALDRLSTELREKLLSAPAKEKGEIEEQMELLLERRATVLPQLEQLRDMAAAGKMLELPLTGRKIPLIADVWAKPELGSGCVKITPAHDANDYEVWQRHLEIGAINIMNPDGTLNENVPEKYRGLTMEMARKAVVEDLVELGLHDPETDREDREIDLAHSDRSKTPIEPYLADQWFVKMGDDFLPSPSGRGAGGEGKPDIAPPPKRKQPLPADLLAFARQLRKSQTDAEQLMWSLLRNRRLAGCKFRRQHPLKPYVLDFYCLEQRLAIELDGGQHNTDEGRAKDEKRTQFIESQGIRVIRFWNHDVLQDTDAVLEVIWRELQVGPDALTQTLTPNPSPSGRGEPEPPLPAEPPLPEGEGRGEGESPSEATPEHNSVAAGKGLAQSAMDAVTDGRVKIVPERYAKGYLDWLREKRDWPIGRQLWWGHRIPVWKKKLNSRVEYEAAGDEAVRLFSSSEEIELEQINESFICDWDEATAIGYGYYCLLNDETELLREIEKSGYAREDEVLDTWFSSALWPHSTLGWPEQTPELDRFYPTSVLVTSRDIITLWVARMVLTGLYNMGEVPFKEVYIHPKILDGYGETMSKSKGNGVDPIDVIDKFGADALRFGIAYLTTETQDVRMPVEFECPHCQALINQTKKNRTLPRIECDKCGQPFATQWAESHGTDKDMALPRGAVVSERFELGRRFCNKLWNASRFSLMNLEGYEPGAVADEDLTLEDRWLLSRLATVTGEVTDALAHYRFADAARTLYAFAWNDFCDYYVEIAKARFDKPAMRATAQRVLAHALDTLLRLLHPIVPFLTEEVWHLLGQVAPQRGLEVPLSPGERPGEGRLAAESICIADWPEADAARIDANIEEQFADFQAVLGAVREIRMGQNIPPKEPIEFCVRCDASTAALLEPMKPYFLQIAKATAKALGPDAPAPERSAGKSLAAIDVLVDVSAFFDVEAEAARLEKERAQLSGHISTLEKKLGNENFVSRAPADVVQQQRDKLAEVQQQLASVEAALAKL